MRIGVFAYPSMVLDPGGGMVTLTKTYEYLRDTGRQVARFDPWSHTLKGFDLIHHFGLGYGNFDWFQTVKGKGRRLAVTTMYWLPDRPRTARLSRKLLGRFTRLKPPPAQIRLMLDLADLILPNSEGEKRLLMDLYGCSEEKLAVVPCGVDDRFVGASPDVFSEKYGITDHLLCIGRFDPRQKNQLGLIRAMKDTDIPLVFVGRPITGAEAYLAQCREEASPNTHFIDYLDPSEDLLASAFASANTLVVPSFYEYPCMVAMEALLTGTKVAITEGGTTCETFGEFVTYFDPHSPAQMRAAVLATYEQPLPDGAEAYARRTFLWDRVGKCLDSAYEQAGFV